MAETLIDRRLRTAEPGPGTCPRYPPGRLRVGGSDAAALRRLDHARIVLERARVIVERGWLQNGWYVARPTAPAPARGLRRLLAARSPDVDEVRQACLVGAVAVAAHGGTGRVDVGGDAGPVLDLVWDTLGEAALPGPGAAGRAVPPAVRVSRMRELVRWNDAPGRTRGEVLDLLDRSISRTILTAVGDRTS